MQEYFQFQENKLFEEKDFFSNDLGFKIWPPSSELIPMVGWLNEDEFTNEDAMIPREPFEPIVLEVMMPGVRPDMRTDEFGVGFMSESAVSWLRC